MLEVDQYIFELINRRFANSFFDILMPILREKKTWVLLYVLAAAFLILKYKTKGIWALFFLVVAVASSDLLSAHVIKPIFHRLRPCRSPAFFKLVTQRVPCSSGFSFVSSHASNHFAIAVLFSSLLAKRFNWIWLPSLLWAAAISYAQVYVGLHYPSDVVSGALVGTAISLVMYKYGVGRKIFPLHNPSVYQ